MSAKTARLGQALTPGEREVLAYIAAGMPNLEIALTAFITVDAVRSRVRSLLVKLGARNRAHAVRIGLEKGLIW